MNMLQEILSPPRNNTDVVEPQTTAGAALGAAVNLGPEGVATPLNQNPTMSLPGNAALGAALNAAQTANTRPRHLTPPAATWSLWTDT